MIASGIYTENAVIQQLIRAELHNGLLTGFVSLISTAWTQLRIWIRLKPVAIMPMTS